MKTKLDRIKNAYETYAHELKLYTEQKELPISQRDNSHGEFYKNLDKQKQAMLDAKHELEKLLYNLS